MQYSKFRDVSPDRVSGGGVDQTTEGESQTGQETQNIKILDNQVNQRSTTHLSKKALTILTIQQLICSILLLVCGSICTGYFQSFRFHVIECSFGTSIWSGLIMTFAAVLGVVFSTCQPKNRCLLIAYFVMAIIASCCAVVSIVFSGLFAGLRARAWGYWNEDPNVISLIVSTSFVCYMWTNFGCCRTDEETANTLVVVYKGSGQEIDGKKYVMVPVDMLNAKQT